MESERAALVIEDIALARGEPSLEADGLDLIAKAPLFSGILTGDRPGFD
jgi:hypothetical protein